MKRLWTEKHTPLCLLYQKTTNALNIIDLPPCISDKEKWNVSFFLICYGEWHWTEKHIPICLWSQKTTIALYTIDLPRCTSNKEKGIRKKEMNKEKKELNKEKAKRRQLYVHHRNLYIRHREDKHALLLFPLESVWCVETGPRLLVLWWFTHNYHRA